MSLQIQLKKSAVSQKQPFASDLAVGELALNYNADGPFLTCKDTAGNVRKLNNVWVGATPPTSPSAGDLWLDINSATPVLKAYKDSTTTWVGATSVPLATTTVFGTVRLASAADVTNGTSGKVVDAAQLQSKVAAEISSALNASPTTIQDLTVSNNATITGNLTVNGTTTTLDTTNLLVEDKNIEMGVVATPTNTTADGGGITLRGTTNKTINWVNATGAWTSSERFSYPLGTAAAPTITFTGDPNTGIYSPGADQVAISTNGTGRLFVGSNGRVGVNTSSAPSLFVVSKAGAEGIEIEPGDTSGVNLTRHYNRSTDAFVTSSIYAFNHIFYTGVTEAMRLDSSGRLGLGTSGPSRQFHLQNSGNALAKIDSTSATGIAGIDINNADRLWFAGVRGDFSDGFGIRDETANAMRVLIDSSGRVGIGTTSPGFNLDVSGSGTQTIRAITTDTSGFSVGGFQANYLGGGGGTASAAVLRAGDGYTLLAATTNSPLLLGTNNTERARITSDGKLGLGTSSPSTLLTLSEDQGTTITLRRNNSAAVLNDLIGKIDFFNNDGSSPGARVTATVGAYAQSTAGGTYLAFSTATNGGSNAERLRIDQAGNVGIGTTSPVSRLHASQGGDSNVITYVQGATKGLRIGTNTTGALLEGVDGTNGATSYEPLLVGGSEVRFTTSAIERARIDSSGRLLVGTSSALTTRLLTTTLTPSFQVKEGGGGSALFFCGINGAAPATVFAAKSRGTSYGTIVQNNDGLLRISAAGDDGVQATEAARIEAFVDGTPGANDMPGRLVFSTTADGASSPTERMRITSAGQLLVGATSARSVGAVAPLSAKVQIETTEYYGFSVVNNTNDSSPSVIVLGKSRGTSTGSSTVVQSGDELGIIGFAGADGTDLQTLAAAISADVDGTPGANDMPGRLVFSVTADGASSPTEAMRIKNTRVINFSNAPVYADNAAAKAGGLVDGDVYRTSTGDLKIVYT